MPVHVRLKPTWPGTFRRTIKRDDKGKSLEVRTFTPGEVVKIPNAELPYLADDLGKSLQPMEWSDEFNKFRPVDLSEIDLPAMVAEIKAGPVPDEDDDEETSNIPNQEPPDGEPPHPNPLPRRRGRGDKASDSSEEG